MQRDERRVEPEAESRAWCRAWVRGMMRNGTLNPARRAAMRLASAVPVDRAADFEAASDGQVRRWHMFPATWHRIWPELIGADGAPPVPAEQQEAA